MSDKQPSELEHAAWWMADPFRWFEYMRGDPDLREAIDRLYREPNENATPIERFMAISEVVRAMEQEPRLKERMWATNRAAIIDETWQRGMDNETAEALTDAIREAIHRAEEERRGQDT